MRHLSHFSRRSFCGAALIGAVAIGALAVLPGCQSTSEDSDAPGASVEVPAGNFAVEWRADVPVESGPISEVNLVGDRVIVYTQDNRGYFINRAGGSLLGSVRAARPRAGLFAPLASLDTIVLPSTFSLSVFNKNGKPLHEIELTSVTGSSGAVAADKYLIFGVDNPTGGRAVAVENKKQNYTLSPIWQLMTRGQVTATPATFQEGIYVGSRDGGVYAVRLGDREALWPGLSSGFFKTGGEILADLSADKDGVYVASMDGKVYCLDPLTGRVRWTYYAGQSLREASGPVATADTVYVYVPREGVAAIDKRNIQEIRPHKWRVAGARQFLAADAQNVYLRADDNTVLAVDRATGSPKFKSQRQDFVAFATNTMDDGVIYAANAGGNVYAIRPVLKPGTMGEMVMDLRPVEVASRD